MFVPSMDRVMYMVYNLALYLAALILAPLFLFRATKDREARSGLLEKLGFVRPLADALPPVLWIHAVSVGETLAVVPLIKRTRQEWPQCRIVVTTTTVTGQGVAREKLNGSAEVRYFPFDFKSCVRRSLNRINPTAVLVAETEVWPNFIQECVKREVPVFLVNARLSDQSFHRYQQIGFWLGPILQCLHRILAQDEPSATRFRQLGADKSRVDTTGNLKFDILPSADLSAKAAELDQMLGLSQTRVVLAGSTAPAEERILLDAFVSLQPQAANPPIRLVIAPRHPERFDEVQDLLERSCLTWTRRSKPSDHATARSASVVLLDTIGELQAAYSLAEIAFVGGSLVNVGGHNVLEPALFGKPIVVGPYTSNFTSIIQSFRDGAALIQLPHASEAGLRAQLTAELRALLESPSRAHEMGLRAQQLLARNRGATERTLKAIAPFLDRDSSTRQPHQS